MLGLIELVLIVFVVLAFLSWRKIYAVLQGRSGRLWQGLMIAGIVLLAFRLNIVNSWLIVVGAAAMLVYLLLSHKRAPRKWETTLERMRANREARAADNANSSDPLSPPPIPRGAWRGMAPGEREVVRPDGSIPQMERQSTSSILAGGLFACLLAVFVVLTFYLWQEGPRADRARMVHAIQPPPQVVDEQDDLHQLIDHYVKDAKEKSKRVLRKALDSTAEAVLSHVDEEDVEEVVEKDPDGKDVVIFNPHAELEIPKDVKRVQFLSETYGNVGEADQSLVERIGEFLVMAAIQEGYPCESTVWRPDPNWVSRNFAGKREIIPIKSEEDGVTLYVASAEIDVPDENKAEQIWHEYISDRSAGRALTLLKGYAGSVLIVGGVGVFLRLGTGRHLRVGGVSYKRRWFGKRGARG